jgi:hypothetical protein
LKKCPRCKEKVANVRNLVRFISERFPPPDLPPDSAFSEGNIETIYRRARDAQGGNYSKVIRLAYILPTVVLVLLLIFPEPGDIIGNAQAFGKACYGYWNSGRHVKIETAAVTDDHQMHILHYIKDRSGKPLKGIRGSPDFIPTTVQNLHKGLPWKVYVIDEERLQKNFELFVSQTYRLGPRFEDHDIYAEISYWVWPTFLSDYSEAVFPRKTLLLSQTKKNEVWVSYKDGRKEIFFVPGFIDMSLREADEIKLEGFPIVVPNEDKGGHHNLPYRFQRLSGYGQPVKIGDRWGRMIKEDYNILIWTDEDFLFSLVTDLPSTNLISYAKRVKPVARTE